MAEYVCCIVIPRFHVVANAAVRSLQLSLLVTEIPGFKKNRVDTFQSKRDLIDCNMASVHLVSRF